MGKALERRCRLHIDCDGDGGDGDGGVDRKVLFLEKVRSKGGGQRTAGKVRGDGYRGCAVTERSWSGTGCISKKMQMLDAVSWCSPCVFAVVFLYFSVFPLFLTFDFIFFFDLMESTNCNSKHVHYEVSSGALIPGLKK